MKILHLFSGYNTFSCAAHLRNIEVISLDIKKYKNYPAPTITQDFMNFDYTQFDVNEFDFIIIGFPCTTFSKAAGNFHFKNHIPVTDKAKLSLLMIDKMIEIIIYYNCYWMIENPTSALFSNKYFLSHIQVTEFNLIRCHQGNYGHIAYKQTDLLTNKFTLWLDNPLYRVNGNYSKTKFANLTIKQRQSYPIEFCNRILDFIQEE
jgi:hypothetical protein